MVVEEKEEQGQEQEGGGGRLKRWRTATTAKNKKQEPVVMQTFISCICILLQLFARKIRLSILKKQLFLSPIVFGNILMHQPKNSVVEK